MTTCTVHAPMRDETQIATTDPKPKFKSTSPRPADIVRIYYIFFFKMNILHIYTRKIPLQNQATAIKVVNLNLVNFA